MRFYINRANTCPQLEALILPILTVLGAQGHQLSSNSENVQFVLNLTDVEKPVFFRRNSKALFVVSFVQLPRNIPNLRARCYQTLVRTLSNLLICFVPKSKATNVFQTEVYFTTPEAGFYHIPYEPQAIYQRMLPIISAHFVIDNLLESDLPQAFWEHSKAVEQLRHFGHKLDTLGVLPTPFPLNDFLSPEEREHLFQLFRVKGLSYGNLSVRESIPALGPTTFWMTARGINKAQIGPIGQDVLLVKGLDVSKGVVKVSVPPVFNARARVSVDAVEHFLIYQTFQEVGAIVHIHAWMNNIPSTFQNFPCGTSELANEVVHLLKRTENPARAVVGLKNHGLTITGPNLPEIFERIQGKILRQVPMAG